MKRTASITIGVVLASLLTSCADEPESAEFTEVCVDQEMTILPAEQCDDDDDRSHGHSFIYVPGGTHVGAHGTRHTGSFSSTRPASATIGRVPASGGFGTHSGTGS